MADDDLTARIARRGEPEAVPVRFDNKSLRRSVVSVLLVFLAFTVAVWLFGQLSHFLLVLLLGLAALDRDGARRRLAVEPRLAPRCAPPAWCCSRSSW